MSVESMYYKKPTDEEKISAVLRYRKGEDIRVLLDELKITFMDLKGWNMSFDKEVKELLSPTEKIIVPTPDKKEEERKSLDAVIKKHFPAPDVLDESFTMPSSKFEKLEAHLSDRRNDAGLEPDNTAHDSRFIYDVIAGKEPEPLELEVQSAPSITKAKKEKTMPKATAKKKARSAVERRKFTMEEKVTAVEKLLEGGSATTIANEMNVSTGHIYKWKAAHEKAAQKNIAKRAKVAAKVPEAKAKRSYNKKPAALKADLTPTKVKVEKPAPEFTAPAKAPKSDNKDALISSLYQVIGNLTIENMRLKGQI